MAVRYLTKDLKEEINENREHIVVLERNDAIQDLLIKKNCKGVEKLVLAVDTVETAIIKIQISNAQVNKVASWAIGIVTTILVVVLVALITGQATLQFK